MGDQNTEATTRVEHARPAEHETYLLVWTEAGMAAFPMPRAGRVSIGRSADCDVHVDHVSVSRRHAEIEVADGTLVIRDFGSANGTFVEGKRIGVDEPRPLEPGQSALVGSVTLSVQRASTPLNAGPGTGHRYVETRLREECARGSRSGGRFTFARLEMHSTAPAGTLDAVFAKLLRVSDVVAAAEPGCHELLLVDTDAESAGEALARISGRLRELGYKAVVGVAHFPQDGESPEKLMATALTRMSIASGASLTASTPPPWRALVEQVADSRLSVLIRGETGVGKELCAAQIHQLSGRADALFLKLNCAAFSETLLESELFGHERGAFTGAVSTKPGLLETAEGGTVFLDEIGDLPLALQAKLLRVLEEREVLRIGALTPRRIDVRFVAATNRPLERDIEERRFRRDLLYRLAGAVIEIPALRDRLDELDGLCAAFVASACDEANRDNAPKISHEARTLLRAHAWPGNIRELRNAIERAVLLCPAHSDIDPEHLPGLAEERPTLEMPVPQVAKPSTEREPAKPGRTRRAGLNSELAEIERRQICEALDEFGGNQTRAAKKLGMSRTTLQKRMDTYGLARPRKRPPSA